MLSWPTRVVPWKNSTRLIPFSGSAAEAASGTVAGAGKVAMDAADGEQRRFFFRIEVPHHNRRGERIGIAGHGLTGGGRKRSDPRRRRTKAQERNTKTKVRYHHGELMNRGRDVLGGNSSTGLGDARHVRRAKSRGKRREGTPRTITSIVAHLIFSGNH